MTKFNYIYFKKDKKLRILNSKLNSKLTVVFLHGLKSDMEGKKPLFLNRYCKMATLAGCPRAFANLATAFCSRGKISVLARPICSSLFNCNITINKLL